MNAVLAVLDERDRENDGYPLKAHRGELHEKTMELLNSEEFARVMVAMGEFMAQGRTYEETYRQALTITEGPYKIIF